MILILELALFIFYVVMAFCFYTIWIEFFKQDPPSSSEEKLLSHLILGVATVLWPIIVPFAYLQLLKSKLQDSTFSSYTSSQYRETSKQQQATVGI